MVAASYLMTTYRKKNEPTRARAQTTAMTDITFISAILLGLAGGVHCVGMCGGIVGAFSMSLPQNASVLRYSLSYNLGRIISYTIAGSITGLLGMMFANQIEQGLVVLQFVSAVFLFCLALYVSGWWQGLVKIEKLGHYIWRVVQPWAKPFIPFKHPLYALPYGIIWGWLPCGLVYSVLTWSLASGSWFNGAKIMFGFGLGTLPVMILMALGFNRLKTTLQSAKVRTVIALLLIVFAGYQILQAINLSILSKS